MKNFKRPLESSSALNIGGSHPGSPHRGETSSQDSHDDEAIKVVVRFQPTNGNGDAPLGKVVWRVDSDNKSITQATEARDGDETFSYDAVFLETASKKEIYDSAAKDIVQFACTGGERHGIIYTCGQTSFGTIEEGIRGSDIVNMAASEIFDHLSSAKREFRVRVSFIDFYEAEARLADRQFEAEEFPVPDVNELLNFFCNRSNSRKIFRIAIESKNNGAIQVSNLYFVHLAVSQAKGDMFNGSLWSLSREIVSLGKQGSQTISSIEDSSSPLESSLSKKARMALICCASRSEHHVQETRFILEFANRAKLIDTCPTCNGRLEKENGYRSPNIERISETEPSKQKLPADLETTELEQLKKQNQKELPPFLEPIDHLSVHKMSGGLPEWTFYLHGEDDTILYEFKANAATSGIEGAGDGAFISFEGGYRLKEDIRRQNDELWDLVVDNSNPMPMVREAVLPDGFQVQVTIIGEGLYEPYESWPKIAATRQLLTAKIPSGAPAVFEKTLEKVRIVGDGIHDVYHRLDKREGQHPFGYLSTNTFSDYVHDQSIKSFEMNENCIDLGCYGPFLRRHWKHDDVFRLKSFLFQQVPNEWAFGVGVDQEIEGQPLLVDITDDLTGSPSAIARMRIPMYVNEVGYNRNLRQNVFPRSVGMKIHYYFMTNMAMQIGRPIELLTTYKANYESVRERQGYGYRNLHEGLPSDELLVARLERNFFDREDAENVILLVDACGRQRLLGFLQYEWDLLYKKHPHTPIPIVALRRLMCLVKIFGQKFGSTRAKNGDTAQCAQCWCQEVVRNGTKLLCQFLESTDNKDLCREIRSELQEEVFYHVRKSMPLLMDENLYCPMSRNLIDRLCSLDEDSGGFVGEHSLFASFIKDGSIMIEQIETQPKEGTEGASLPGASGGEIVADEVVDFKENRTSVKAEDKSALAKTTSSSGLSSKKPRGRKKIDRPTPPLRQSSRAVGDYCFNCRTTNFDVCACIQKPCREVTSTVVTNLKHFTEEREASLPVASGGEIVADEVDLPGASGGEIVARLWQMK